MNLSRRAVLAGMAVAGGAPSLARAAPRGPVNPLVRRRADAQIFRHDDGSYYMTASVPEYDRVVLRRARTIAGLTTAPETVLWRRSSNGPTSGFIWAPELHRIDDRWIIYFAAGPSGGGEDVFRIRTYALACDGADPLTGGWKVLGQLQTPWDSFNLDSTSFVHRGVRYLAWAQREPGIDTNSNLYLAPLATPLTLAAKPVRLTVPSLPWEVQGFKVAEGPAPLVRNGRFFMTYSASATDARYCMGMLTAREDADLMNPASWTKSPTPVFVSSPETGVWGPGHNSFTVDEQGRDMLVYHGRDYERITGDPLFDPNRHTRVQRLYYGADGAPDFGVPVGEGALPERFRSARGFLRYDGDRLTVGEGPLAASQFRYMPDGSIQPILRREMRVFARPDGRVLLASAERSRFRRVPGLSDPRGVSFALAAKPDRYLLSDGAVVRCAVPTDAQARRAATFSAT